MQLSHVGLQTQLAIVDLDLDILANSQKSKMPRILHVDIIYQSCIATLLSCYSYNRNNEDSLYTT